jgi:hypothetical protein
VSHDPLYVQTDGVRSYAQAHDEVAAGLSPLTGSAAPEAAGVQSSHGTIAAAVGTALADVLGVRNGTLQTTATSGSTISELLHKAAQMYDEGDQKGAATLRAAAEKLGGTQGTGGGSSAGVGEAGAMGQMIGQVAQQAGQLAQPLQGVTQGLQQIPQQVMQLSQSGVDEAAPGDSAGSGRSPAPPRAEDAKPAQTRTQSD